MHFQRIIERKQGKVDKVRKTLGKLTAEVGRREKRGKETRKLRRNIRLLKMREKSSNSLRR